ncbi:uncharacterized protein SCHCODRAFT_073984 [Schizophyllum commune H4-8]|uniref:Expressed protein n=1 Tax=Schizophyllum commune (strain H4-8 / FGSC 9210) TaxID=578458 RepID=D8PV00_SCHCM|nr:uncharacterized protein SCHCODRAFT_073984 [Schizophyllum commune H4-8]KAI5900554.1 hypothetical protein SCHCODRAFT_073984 [Schizophyllum commune H4-8]
MAEYSPAREVVIALQEALEHVASQYDDDADEDAQRSLAKSLVQIIDLYTAAIPRLKLRRKTAAETIDPLLQEITRVVNLASMNCAREDGREVLSAIARLASSTSRWIDGLDIDRAAADEAKRRMSRALEDAVSSCSGSIQSALSQRTFNELYPRLARMSGPLPEGWEEGANAVRSAGTSHEALNGSTSSSTASIGSLILSSHSTETPTATTLSSAMPALLTSLQTNVALDESLALLLRVLSQPTVTLSPDLLFPLSTLLPTVASMHPDPTTRHISFRILSLLLRAAPSHVRLDILKELTADEGLPQMMVAAIGLVKEAFLDGLNNGDADVFASRRALQELGGTVLRTNPPDVLEGVEQEKFLESVEPRRLTEILSLVYVLLNRDVENKTGIRDKDTLRALEANILKPLRRRLAEWMDEGGEEEHDHDIMSLVGLSISLERVDATLAELGAS